MRQASPAKFRNIFRVVCKLVRSFSTPLGRCMVGLCLQTHSEHVPGQCFFDFHNNIWDTDASMLISSKATDTIYQAVLHLLEQQGIVENEPLQQHVLLRDGMFLGYRFQGVTMQVDWLAQNDVLVLKNQDRILLQKQLTLQNSAELELTSRAS